MNAERIEEIRKRVEALWDDGWYKEVETVGNSASYYVQPGVAQVATDVEAEFIAHAREDIPALLAEVERLRDKIMELGDCRCIPDKRIGYERMREENTKFREALMDIAQDDTWTATPKDIAATALGLYGGAE